MVEPKDKIKYGFIKLLLLSVLSANIGYSLFLLPVLGILYPEKVPLSFINIIAFAGVDTAAGILLGIIIFVLDRKTRFKMEYSAGAAITFMWFLYWIPVAFTSFNLVIICLDGAAALFTWTSFIILDRIMFLKNPAEIRIE